MGFVDNLNERVDDALGNFARSVWFVISRLLSILYTALFAGAVVVAVIGASHFGRTGGSWGFAYVAVVWLAFAIGYEILYLEAMDNLWPSNIVTKYRKYNLILSTTCAAATGIAWVLA